jgi:hypothetical protein
MGIEFLWGRRRRKANNTWLLLHRSHIVHQGGSWPTEEHRVGLAFIIIGVVVRTGKVADSLACCTNLYKINAVGSRHLMILVLLLAALTNWMIRHKRLMATIWILLLQDTAAGCLRRLVVVGGIGSWRMSCHALMLVARRYFLLSMLMLLMVDDRWMMMMIAYQGLTMLLRDLQLLLLCWWLLLNVHSSWSAHYSSLLLPALRSAAVASSSVLLSQSPAKKKLLHT